MYALHYLSYGTTKLADPVKPYMAGSKYRVIHHLLLLVAVWLNG